MKLFFKIKLSIQPENLLEAFCDMFKIDRWSPSNYKNADGSTHIFSWGYNNCDQNDPRRVERGIEVEY